MIEVKNGDLRENEGILILNVDNVRLNRTRTEEYQSNMVNDSYFEVGMTS